MNNRFLTRKNGLSIAVAIGLGLVGTAAMAQSNSSGVIFGRTTPGAVIHVDNKDTGLSRDITVASDGRYRASSLPVGNYKVSLEQDGKIVDTRDNVAVTIGGTEVSFPPRLPPKALRTSRVCRSSPMPCRRSTCPRSTRAP